MRQYSWARSNCRTMVMSSALSMRTNTIGNSPEMPCAHSAFAPPLPRRMVTDDGRIEEFA